MGKMALSFMDHPHVDRKTRCLEVGNLVNNIVDNEQTDFGKAFATAIRCYNVATEASQAGVLISKAAPDLLWLIDRFFEACYPEGGEVDMASSSAHPQSVYRTLSRFCSQCLYKTHPHIQTLKAFVDIAKMQPWNTSRFEEFS